MNEKKPIVLIGSGGHASVLADILLSQNREILAVVSPEDTLTRKVLYGLKHFKEDNDITQFPVDEIVLINGIGMLPRSMLRKRISQYFIRLGYQFEAVVADTAKISKYAKIGTGTQVLIGAVINAGAVIGDDTIVNTRAVVEHDCQIGRDNHIAPNATLCGGVFTASDVYIGANATIVQGVKLAEKTVVGANAILTQNLSYQNICYPSRSLIKTTD